MDTDTTTDQRRLEANANRLRSRLARTLESLDRRRHDAMNVRVQVGKHPVSLAVLGDKAIAAIDGKIGMSMYRSRNPWRRMLKQRTDALVRAWKHPDRSGKPAKDPFVADIARSVAISLASFGLTQLAKYAMEKYFPIKIEKKVDGHVRIHTDSVPPPPPRPTYTS